MADEGSLRQQIRSRDSGMCEYCRVSDEFVSTPYQMDHIIAEKHGGITVPDNLAWSCLHCNSFKGPNIAGRDTITNQTVPLYNPRDDEWRFNFEWRGPVLEGRTPIGRATIAVLRINLAYRIAVRESLIGEGVFPPD